MQTARIVKTLIILLMGFFSIVFSHDLLKMGFPMPYRQIIEGKVSDTFPGVMLVYSVIRAESRYDPEALSYAGAKGLMQITDDTFEMISSNISLKDNVYDPETNISAGIWYLEYLYSQLGDERLSVRAYNCGIGNLGFKIPQTDIFEQRVFEFHEIYKWIYSDLSS